MDKPFSVQEILAYFILRCTREQKSLKTNDNVDVV